MRHFRPSFVDFRPTAFFGGCCVLATLSFLVGCGGADAAPEVVADGANDPPAKAATEKVATKPLVAPPQVDSEFVPSSAPVVDRTPSARPQVVIRTSRGDITIELFRNEAPQTVRNFLETYVENGLYSHTIFHHVDAGFIAIAGGYDEKLRPVYSGEPIANESSPERKNLRGTVAMIRLPDDANSATSQFFFNLNDNPDFDAAGPGDGYCVFGRIVKGIEVLDAISASPTMSTGEFTKIPSDSAEIAAVEVLRY